MEICWSPPSVALPGCTRLIQRLDGSSVETMVMLAIKAPKCMGRKSDMYSGITDVTFSWNISFFITVGIFYSSYMIPIFCMINTVYQRARVTLIPEWIRHYIHHEVWDEITYPFPNFNGATVEVWEWISNFIPHFTGHVINYPYWD